jgi:D-xylose reductase
MFKTEQQRVGLGLWKVSKDDCADAVYNAIKIGYRHLDSACDYGNEKEVGQGIARAIDDGLVTREDLWITSKLWNTYHAPEHVQPALERTLNDLGLEYLDLYLIHFPIAQAFVPFETRYPPEWFHDPQAADPKMEFAQVPLHQTWHAMESLVDSGSVKHIGVCNYNSALLFDLVNYARIKPAMLQVEIHPYHTQQRLLTLANNLGIPVTAFSPLGAQSYVEIDMATQAQAVIAREEVLNAAKAHNVTPAQVVLRWGIQRGYAVIPKSTNPKHLAENLDLFNFSLTQVEMEAISGLNLNHRFNDPGHFCGEAFNTHCPIYD